MRFEWLPNPPRGAANPSSAGLVAVALALLLPAAASSEEVIAPPSFRPGMAWTYQQREDITGRAVGAVRLEIVTIASGAVSVDLTLAGEQAVTERWDATGNWQQVGSRGWDWLARLGGRSKMIEFVPALALYQFPLRPGASWVDTAHAVDPDSGRKTELKLFAKAIRWEEVTVPAGKFLALKVRRTIAPNDPAEFRSRTTVSLVDWYSPQVSGSVRSICDWEFQDDRRPRGDQLVKGGRMRWELTGYTPAK